jgi:hypothetical protein
MVLFLMRQPAFRVCQSCFAEAEESISRQLVNLPACERPTGTGNLAFSATVPDRLSDTLSRLLQGYGLSRPTLVPLVVCLILHLLSSKVPSGLCF